MMVLCLHPSAKKSSNAKTQTQAQKERLMSHPFLPSFNPDQTFLRGHCVGDLIQPPGTFTESHLGFWYSVLFQELTSSFSAAYWHILSKTDYNAIWEYFGVCKYIRTYNIHIHIHTYLYGSMVHYGPTLCKTPAICHRNLAAWLAPALDGLQYRRQIVFRVEGKWGKRRLKRC